jgi:hypothetical protein
MQRHVRRTGTFMYLLAFPLLLVPFALYNMIAFLLGMEFNARMFGVPLLSGRTMDVTLGDLMVLLGVILLYFEILKSTQMSSKAIMDHVLSMILFLAMTVEFIVVRQAATSTFFVLLALSFVDVVGGFTITIRTAQRDVEFQSDRGPGV